MIGATATAAEMQNNFGKYLDMVLNGQEVIVTRNGKEVGRLIPRDAAAASLTGILEGGGDPDAAREKRLKEK